MCDIVDCLKVQDPEAKINEVRTVPLLCPGEWANNFIIDGLNIEDVDYIGEPYGLISSAAPDLFRYTRFIDEQPRVWVYSGRIMGGLSSWWSTKKHTNSAKIVDAISGFYITGITYDSTTGILPYYYKEASNYYVLTDDSYQRAGWVSGIASKKLLIFGVIDNEQYKRKQTAFLFMEEGPAWSSSCSRSPLPALSSSEAYAPLNVGIDVDSIKNSHIVLELMPGMEYPVSEPRITGEMFQIGDEGPAINEQALRPIEVKIVPGRANKPIVYVPSEDKYYPAVKNETDNNAVFFGRVEAELIPPDSSLVMVKLEKISPEGPLDCRTSPEKIQLSYPGYYPITTSPKILQEFNLGVLLWLCSDDDFTEKWLVFKFPSLDIDQSQLLFSIKGEEKWIFWSLAEN
ncbi:hypothetical protein KA005_23690 [bacterium]|nr:hypothetical protein [bacterium]